VDGWGGGGQGKGGRGWAGGGGGSKPQCHCLHASNCDLQVCQHLRKLQLQNSRSTGSFAKPASRCMSTFASSSNGTSESAVSIAEPSEGSGAGGGLAVAVRTDAGRIVDTSLQDEVEKSYLAVSSRSVSPASHTSALPYSTQTAKTTHVGDGTFLHVQFCLRICIVVHGVDRGHVCSTRCR